MDYRQEVRYKNNFQWEGTAKAFGQIISTGTEIFLLRPFDILVQVSYTQMSIDQAPSLYCDLPLLEFLRKYTLPKLHPLLLLLGERLSWILEWPSQYVSQTRTHDFNHKHGFPVWYGKPCSVSIEDENTGIHLVQISANILVTSRILFPYIATNIAAKQRDSKFLNWRRFMGIVKPGTSKYVFNSRLM